MDKFNKPPQQNMEEPVVNLLDFRVKADYLLLRDRAKEIIENRLNEIKAVSPKSAKEMEGPINTDVDLAKRAELSRIMGQAEEVYNKAVEAAKEGKPQELGENFKTVVAKLQKSVNSFETISDGEKEAANG